MNDYANKLTELGWRCQKIKGFDYIEFWYKRFTQAERCCCNSEKEGIQVGIKVYPPFGHYEENTYEISICGELVDERWADFTIRSIHGDKELLDSLESNCVRLLAAWNLVAGMKSVISVK